MKQVEWIKIRVDMFEDEKMRLIQALPEGDAITAMWIRLLTMAGRTNDDGYIYLKEGTPYTAQMLAIIFTKQQSVVELALRTFIDFGMIQFDDKGIFISNWEKHQNIDGLDKIKKQTSERVRRYRERKKQEHLALPKPSEEGNVTVTQGNAIERETEREEETDTDIEKEKEQKVDLTKKPLQNLCSKEEVSTFVESHSTFNLLSVSKKLLVDFINCLRLTRKTGRISSELIKTECEKWRKYPPTVITYAMWLHMEKHDDKKEEYTLGIMRNTNEYEATQELKELANKALMTGGETYDEHTTSTFTDPKPNEPATTGKWDHLVIH